MPYITNTGADIGEITIDCAPLMTCIDANSAHRKSLKIDLDLKKAKSFVTYNENSDELIIAPGEDTEEGNYEITLEIKDSGYVYE